MFLGDNFAWLRLELGADLATPSAELECLGFPPSHLDWRNVLPSLVIAWPIAMMHRIKNVKPDLPGCIQDFEHVGNTLVSFRNVLNPIPYFSSLGNKVVIWIDHQKCSD